MSYRFFQLFLAVISAIMLILFNGFAMIQSEAQSTVRLRKPFSGTYRLTAYVDHRDPNYTYDQHIVVHNGEERKDCPGVNDPWTDQGPYCYDGHNGTDYALPNNTQVLAAARGIVTHRGWRSADYGHSIRIDHGGGYQTWYSHLSNYSVNWNDEVAPGQLIGYSGDSGGVAAHLHFEVLHNGQVTDPFGWRGDWNDPIPDGPATCLWGDGQCSEIVIEDESAWFTKELSGWQWHHQGNSWTMRYVSNFQWTPHPHTATWRPDLPFEGPYHVYAFIPAVHGTTTDARYYVSHKNGSATVHINQLVHSDDWVDLGTYEFWDGLSGSVYLENITGEPIYSTEISFDSMKFVQFQTFLPTVYSE